MKNSRAGSPRRTVTTCTPGRVHLRSILKHCQMLRGGFPVESNKLVEFIDEPLFIFAEILDVVGVVRAVSIPKRP